LITKAELCPEGAFGASGESISRWTLKVNV
jgi:hypothetical protein